MKVFRGLVLQFKGVNGDEDANLLQQIQSLEIDEALDGIAQARLRYSELHVPKSLTQAGKGGKPEFPGELRILTGKVDAVASGSAGKSSELAGEETCLFRGPLTVFEHQSYFNRNGVILNYSDPLVVMRERDKTMIWSGVSLQDIVTDLLKGAYQSSGRDLEPVFEGGAVPQPKTLTNMDKENFRFVAEDVAARYGYRFHFCPTDRERDVVRFFKPELQPSGAKRLGMSALMRCEFKFVSDFQSTPNAVAVHASGGATTTVSLEDFKSELSHNAQGRLAARDASAMKLQMNWAFPNLASSESETVAKALFHRAAWQSDALEFESDEAFGLGDYLCIEGDEMEVPAYLEGHFLIERVRRTYRGPQQTWWHHYRAVRA